MPANVEIIGTITCNTNKEEKIIPKSKELAAAHGGDGLYYDWESQTGKAEKPMRTLFPKTTLIVIHKK